MVRPSQLPPGAAEHEPTGAPAPAGQLAASIAEAALELGFAKVGFCPVQPFERGARALESWLGRGLHGQMAYMAGPRADPSVLLAQARSLVVVALPYRLAPSTDRTLPLQGQVAAYARGDDYHQLMKAKLRNLAERIAGLVGRTVLARPCVDSAPLLEREAAARAGVGFIAKSTLAIAPGLGSSILLGELLIDVELPPAEPVAPGCGGCTACLDACPTGAFVAPHVLDARRCISYLTIELRGSIPRELRPSIGSWVFGCDICQAVCPYNASPAPRPSAPELAPRPPLSPVELVRWLELGAAEYRRLVKGSALSRVSRAGLGRNAAVALGNSGDPAAVAPLRRAVEGHYHPLVREHAAWALGRLGGELAREALEHAAAHDPEASVRAEARAALDDLA